MNPIGRKKRMVYVGRRNWIDRMGIHFERYVPLDVDLLIARKLVMAYPLDYEMVWEGAPDVLPARGNHEEAAEDSGDVSTSDVVVEQIAVEDEAPKKSASSRGRPKKVALS